MGYSFVETGGLDILLTEEGLSLGLGGTHTVSLSDWKLETNSVYISFGAAIGAPVIDGGFGVVNYTPSGKDRKYQSGELGRMLTDMISGKYSPIPQSIKGMGIPKKALNISRGNAAYMLAPYYFYIYEEMRNERIRSEAGSG